MLTKVVLSAAPSLLDRAATKGGRRPTGSTRLAGKRARQMIRERGKKKGDAEQCQQRDRDIAPVLVGLYRPAAPHGGQRRHHGEGRRHPDEHRTEVILEPAEYRTGT